MNHDVFNGDADGICALHQLRLAFPATNNLVTGTKRDNDLLQNVEAGAGDEVTVLAVESEIVVGDPSGGDALTYDAFHLLVEAVELEFGLLVMVEVRDFLARLGFVIERLDQAGGQSQIDEVELLTSDVFAQDINSHVAGGNKRDLDAGVLGQKQGCGDNTVHVPPGKEVGLSIVFGA